MKTERRHELKQNELAQTVSSALEQIVPYWQVIVGVVVLFFTGYFALTYLNASRQRSVERGWTDYLSAATKRDVDALKQVAQTNSGSTVGAWAMQAAAQAKLSQASITVHQNRLDAQQGFREAADGFQEVLRQTQHELLRQRGTWGLAKAHEGLNDLTAAKEHYQTIVDTWPNTSIAELAAGRIQLLSDPKTQEFYKWFFSTEPPKAAAATGTGSNAPGMSFGDLPSGPDFSVPSPAGGASTSPSVSVPSVSAPENADPESPAVGDLDQPGTEVNPPDSGSADTSASE